MKGNLNQLIEIKEKVAGYQTCRCKMRHENAWLDPETGMPEVQPIVGGVRRVGLCSKEIREKRLSCAHTTSWQKIANAILKLCEITGADDSYQENLLEEFNQCVRQIIACDREKGEQEKIRALLKIRAMETGKTQEDLKLQQQEATAVIEELIEAHDGAVEKLECFRLELIKQLDVAISGENFTNGIILRG